MNKPRMLIASPHRYEDLARLWFRFASQNLIPALQQQGFKVDTLIFCDGCEQSFSPDHFPEVELWTPSRRARDFIDFYDATLELDYDYLFFLDADVFFLQGTLVAERLQQLSNPSVAAISFLQEDDLPGSIYALCCRRSAYSALPKPVFASRYDNISSWPDCKHFDPGAHAALCLKDKGLNISVVDDPHIYLVDFHGTTNLRISRSLFGHRIGRQRFLKLVEEKPYFIKAGYDNLLLARLYQRIFKHAFAVSEATECGQSLTQNELLEILCKVQDRSKQQSLLRYFERSNLALSRLAKSEGFCIELSDLLSLSW